MRNEEDTPETSVPENLPVEASPSIRRASVYGMQTVALAEVQ
jgi:hypothetical protein